MAGRHAIALGFFLLFVFLPAQAAKKPQKWLEVCSPHFTVVSNGGAKQARRVARHFEMIRGVFQQNFPATRLDPATPLVILAAKDEASLRAVLPGFWEKKGGLHPAGIFVRGPEKNYVALRMDITGPHSYHVIYHEYFHMITSLNFGNLPLWLNEGLAEFFATAVVHDEEVDVGRPDDNVFRFLRQSRLMPLEVLFAVDRSSPHYNESSKAGIFYAQSWALAHFLQLGDKGSHAPQLQVFLKLILSGENAREAAAQAFGDLTALEGKFRIYLSSLTMLYVKYPAPPGVDEKSFPFRAISPAESAALRGDFMLHMRRNTEARALLEEALRIDPQLAQAHGSMGVLYSQKKDYSRAAEYFEQAVKLDSRSFLAHYYYAAMNLKQSMGSESSKQIEESLRAAIKINPAFAPAYDALAAYYGMRGENLEEAYMLSLHAVQLEPGNARFRITTANLFMRRGRPDDTLRVLELAAPMAKSDEETQAIERVRMQVRQEQHRVAEAKRLEELARAQDEEFRKAERRNPKSHRGAGTNRGNRSREGHWPVGSSGLFWQW